jgi:SAM-dependent methyltransferase
MTGGARDVVAHFSARARTYDRSSAWCTDRDLAAVILDAVRPERRHRVLDVACGTGLVSRLFKAAGSHVTGVDITTDMADQARPHLDELTVAAAERLPFGSDSFDIVTCRQGIQFMTLPDAVAEMVRVTRPGGHIALINLCAYGPADRDEYFEILRLRNPVRRHFFLPEDLPRLLADAGCSEVRTLRHISAEDVDIWADNGAIPVQRQEQIRAAYQRASSDFTNLHAVVEAGGRLVDHMLFVVAVGQKG